MNKITRAIGTGLLTLGITFGAVVAAPVAFAQPAHALTKTSCYYQYIWNGTYPGLKVLSCYYDYNWAEEVFMGRKDGRYYEHVYIRA